MKKANYKKNKVEEKDTGLPVDTELEKYVKELRKQALKEIAEAERKAKTKKGK